MPSITGFKRLFGLIAVFAAVTAAQAQQDKVREVDVVLDRTPEDCLSLNRINRTKVVDDRTVLFYMRGGDVYQNILPRNCPGLKDNDRFMYKPFSNRLCSSDTITVLERFGGGLDRGFTCRLGEYHPISEFEAEELLQANDELAPGRRSPVEVTPVELPDEADADSDDASAEEAVDE
jgi:hypothetical protein